jgi:hypothetical protein
MIAKGGIKDGASIELRSLDQMGKVRHRCHYYLTYESLIFVECS